MQTIKTQLQVLRTEIMKRTGQVFEMLVLLFLKIFVSNIDQFELYTCIYVYLGSS